MQKLQFACEQCGQKLRASARRQGDTVTCPKCQQRTTLSTPLSPRAHTLATPATPATPANQPASKPPSTPSTPPAEADASQVSQLPDERFSSAAQEPAEPQAHTSVETAKTANETADRSEDAEASQAPSSEASHPNNEAKKARTAAPSAGDVPTPHGDDGFDFLGIDTYGPEETEWVVDTHADESVKSFDPHKIAIPRRILYLQGVLLAATALFAFLMGMVFGRSFTAPAVAIQPPQPCELAGRIEFSRGGLAAQPDEGSVVIAVPRDYKPDARERMELEKIGSATDDRDPAVDMLRRIGGDFAITDHLGRYTLELPDHGRYFVLVLSGNSQRPTREELNRLHLSEMGAYFGPAQRLLGDRRFQWRTELLTESQKLDILF